MLKSMLHLILLTHLALGIYAQNALSENRYGYMYYFSKPDFMSRTYQLNDDADLQLQNTAKETYSLVIIEPKDLFANLGATLGGIRDYYDLVEEPLSAGSTEVGEVQELEVNGNPALQSEIIAPFDQVEIAYLLTVVETRDHYAQILCWTLKKNQELYFVDFRKMAASFRISEP